MKKLLLLSFVAVLLISCNDKNISVGYSYGISQISSTAENLATIESFLNEHNCQMTPLIFTGKTLEECDAQALTRFSESASTFTYEDVVALNLDNSTSFSYTCSRYSTPTNAASAILYIGSFVYPQE